jgi:hypothetical protein
LAPGASIGTFTAGGAASLNGNSATILEIDRGAVPNCDRLSAPSIAIAANAVITVTNVGSSLAFQDTFALFSTAVSGSGYIVNLPALTDPNLYWTNRLAVNGTIEVAAIINPLPPQIGFSYTSGQITISWPADHTGWTLLTNSANIADPSKWFPVSGSSAMTNITFTIDPAQPNVFYKLAYPYP